ncbi:MAG: hypothetical protein QNJ13_10605 [Paracoccaceae bacterium]|nr:hypothetical protein [Paracoccaceae bacterium]
MELIADILLIAGALGAAVYCVVLARRLNRFNDLEKGMGGAIAVLSAQVDDMTKTLEAARQTAGSSTGTLDELTGRAETVAQRLELLVASMHDLPGERKASAAGEEERFETEDAPFQSQRRREAAE